MDPNDRERLDQLRRRFIRHGTSCMTPEEILELILTYTSPNADCRALSRELLRRYGSLHSLFSASFHQLRVVGELEESRAFFLTLVNRVGRQVILEDMEYREDAFMEMADMGRYFLELVRGEPQEAFYELCLKDNSFLACYQLTDGGALSPDMETRRELIRRTVEGALKCSANSVAVCHCLSGGVAALSLTDRMTAGKISAALDTIDVTFRDYLVVTDDDFTSLSEMELMEHLLATQREEENAYPPEESGTEYPSPNPDGADALPDSQDMESSQNTESRKEGDYGTL